MRETQEKWEPIESLGPTAVAVAANVRRLRIKRGLAYTELSERLQKTGRNIPTWGLRKIESGGRRVDSDDLVALAVALGVSPATLLMPDTAHSEAWTGPTDLNVCTCEQLWNWLTAAAPLPDGEFDALEFWGVSWPEWLRQRKREQLEKAETTC